MNNESGLFYGWRVVAAASLGLCFSTGTIVVLCFGTFFKPLSQHFHAGRAAVSLAFTLHSFIVAVLLPFIGRLVDRFGARRIILTGTTLFGTILLFSPLLGSRIVYLYIFFIGLGLVAGSTSPVPYGVAVSRWFDRRRGMALGLMMLGLGVGAIALPLVAHQLIVRFGWRIAYAVFGCAALFTLPISFAFLHNDPGDRGLLPDGERNRSLSSPHARQLNGLSWHEMWHRPSFWRLTTAFFLLGASVQAAVIHMPALLIDRGVSIQSATIASALVGVALLLGRVTTGYLLDRFFAPRLAMLLFGLVGVGLALLWGGETGRTAMLAAVLIGFGMGAEADIIAFCISRYFGLKSFGTAFAFAFGAFVLGGAIGTIFMGAGFDRTHSYHVSLEVLFFSVLLGIALMTRLGPYRYAADGAGPS